MEIKLTYAEQVALLGILVKSGGMPDLRGRIKASLLSLSEDEMTQVEPHPLKRKMIYTNLDLH
jgi:hypothetical protein